MEKIRGYWMKYREILTYLFFGGLTTVVNVGLFMALKTGAGLPTGVANAVALAVSILFAYVTNRTWVFESRLSGMAAVKEFVMFIACRLLTGVMDEGIVVLGVDVLGPMVSGDWLWALSVKVLANVIVIVANYVFSKLIIFRKK